MITFKKTDIFLQALFTGVCIWMAVLRNSEWSFAFYPLVGGWQVISTGVHALYRRHYHPYKDRRLYHWFLLLCSFLLATLLMGSIVAGFIMLFAGPLMAGWYFYICCRELSLLSFKNAVHLKR